MAGKLVVKQKGKNFILYESGEIRVDRVRLSYPHVDKAWKKESDKGDPKFSVTGMLDKETHADAIAFIKAHNIKLITDSKLKIPAKMRYFRDGDAGADAEDEAAGENSYAGHWYLSAREVRRPVVRDSDGTELHPVDDLGMIREKFVGGHWGHILVRPWVQKNEHGERLNAGLSAVVFWKKDETFGSAGIDDTDAWGDLPDEDEEGSTPSRPSIKKTTAVDDDEAEM